MTVWTLLSGPRMVPYLRAASGDDACALELYEWSTRIATAAFEVVGHFEVLLRNALDAALAEHYDEEGRGIPWFLLSSVSVQTNRQVEEVRRRLHALGCESRHQIVAGLNFGLWSGLLGSQYEELWRASPHTAFPHGSGRRKEVSSKVDRARKFRNKLAHHDSMLNVDLLFEIRNLIEVVTLIDPDVAVWLEARSTVAEIYRTRPSTGPDTVVVSAARAWPLYVEAHAYVCQAGRSFRPVERIAFYTHQEIQPEVPRIVYRRDNVEWTEREAKRLATGDRNDRKIAAVIRASRSAGWVEGRYEVFLLTAPGAPEHRSLPMAVPHRRQGRGSAFVQRQRYVSLHALLTAATTDDL